MDWIAYPLLVLQMYLMAYKPREIDIYVSVEALGFFIGILASVCLVIFGEQIKSVPVVVTNSIICYINFRGFLNSAKS